MPVLTTTTYRRLLLLIWIVSSLLLLFAVRGNISEWRMGDPDDQLRIVQIRDWLAGQSWFDVTQYRMNPPFGGPMHWSRLVDLPIAGSILLFTPFLGRAGAELATVIAIPLFTYGIVMWCMAMIATRLGGRWAGIAVSVSLFAILPATIQLAPMRIDHHGWQLVAFLIATYGLIRSDRPQISAIAIGVAAAFWMEISIEGLPFAAFFICLLGLRWLQGDDRLHIQFPVATAALAGTAAAFYLITEGLAPANHCDSLSPVHAIALGAVAITACATHLLTTRLAGNLRLAARLVGGALAAVAALSALLVLAPQCAGDAFAGLDPLVREYWYNRTPEGLPLWRLKISTILPEIAGIIAGVIGAAALWRKSAGGASAWRLELSLLFVGSLLVALQVSRASVYPLCLAAMLVAPLIVRMFDGASQVSTLTRRMMFRAAALLLIMPGVLGTHIARALPKSGENPSASAAAKEAAFLALAKQCHSSSQLRQLNQLPPAQLMVGLDASPGILQFSHHKVIATGHHRNQNAMRDVIRAYTGDPQIMRETLRERGVDYLVACRGSFELRIYADKAPDGFWARFSKGQQFPWLVPDRKIGAYELWRVDKAKLAS
jgi:hypothetical protein